MEIQKTFHLAVALALCVTAVVGAETAATPADDAPKTAKLLFYAPFDGTAKATQAGGDANPSVTNGLAFVTGHRGQALFLPRSGTHALAYPVKGNLVAARGTLVCWLRARWTDRPQDEWRQLAVTWNDKNCQVYFDGRPGSEAEAVAGGNFELSDVLAFPRSPERFHVGGAFGKRSDDIWLDDLRIYSEPLSAKQVRELCRSETVAEITLEKSSLFADHKTTLNVKTTSPAGLDLSELRYCIHTRDGKPVVDFRQTLESGSMKLPVNLPAGDYVLRATDDDWFYGCAPFTVRPAGEAPPPVKQKPKPLDGIRRFWRDMNNFDYDEMRRR